jgi:hypothetical protein
LVPDKTSPPTDVAEPGVPAMLTEPVPPPPEDVMRPTRRGFRFTPGILQLGTRAWLREGPFADVDFDERQQAALSEKFSHRLMELSDREGEKVRELVETWLESVLTGSNKLTAEMKQRLGQQASDFVPAMRELVKDFARDARPLLTDGQWELFKEDLRQQFQNLERFEKKVQRWADGGAREDETLDDLDLEGEVTPEGAVQPGKGGRPTRALLNARRQADSDVQKLMPGSWREFLLSAKAFFLLDDKQMAQGERLLADYRRRAEPIVTPQWRGQVRENRVKYNLRGSLNREGLGPWIFHLDNAYNELIAPLKELEKEFRDQVIALATPAQRDAAVAKLRQRAAEHGLQFGDLDAELLRLLPQ